MAEGGSGTFEFTFDEIHRNRGLLCQNALNFGMSKPSQNAPFLSAAVPCGNLST